MVYKIMNDRDEYTGLGFDTLEDAETALNDCPKGWYVDKWWDLYDEWRKQHLVYSLDDLSRMYDP
jgi:hypothetical protein